MAPSARREDEESVSEPESIIPPPPAESRPRPRTWPPKKRGGALTPRQVETLNIIRRHVRTRGVPPSRNELCTELGISFHSGVHGHLEALAKKGWIQLFPTIERGIRLTREGAPILEPEQLAAGLTDHPVLTRIHDFHSLAKSFSGTPECFMQIKDDSMNRRGLRRGGLVAVQLQAGHHTGAPHSGDVVVARVHDEVTMRRLVRNDDGTIELVPESHNPDHATIRIDDTHGNFEIIGIVVGAITAIERGETTDDPVGHDAG